MSNKCTDCNGTGIVYTMDETDIGQTPGSSGMPCPSCSKQTSRKFKLNDKIKHDFLGVGEIVKVVSPPECINGYMIKFDETPPVQYNMGENPTFEFQEDKMELH